MCTCAYAQTSVQIRTKSIFCVSASKTVFCFVSVQCHPSKEYLAVAEKGQQPDIIIYEYPSLRPYRILRGRPPCSFVLSRWVNIA